MEEKSNVLSLVNRVKQEEAEEGIVTPKELFEEMLKEDNISETIVVSFSDDGDLMIRSSGKMTRETAYFMLGVAQMNALQ